MMFDYDSVLFVEVNRNDVLAVLLHARSPHFRRIEIAQTFYDTFMFMYIYGVAFSTGKSISISLINLNHDSIRQIYNIYTRLIIHEYESI